MKRIIWKLISLICFPFPHHLVCIIEQKITILYSIWITKEFGTAGEGNVIGRKCTIYNPQNISIGKGSGIGAHSIIMCNSNYIKSIPNAGTLSIGDNVSISEYCNIQCSNRIVIEDGVLTGRFVLIDDADHGTFDQESLTLPPGNRPIVSKGPIHIAKNVWIGDKVSILSGVTIGEGSIVAAGAVVTKDIPPYCLCGGVPARILKRL